jgi:hypothetical protein
MYSKKYIYKNLIFLNFKNYKILNKLNIKNYKINLFFSKFIKIIKY